MFIKRFFERVEFRKVLLKVSQNRKVVCLLTAKFFKSQPNTWKIYTLNNAKVSHKNVTSKNFRAPKMANIIQQHVKRALKVSNLTFQSLGKSPHVAIFSINIFGSFYKVENFLSFKNLKAIILQKSKIVWLP